MANNLIRNLFSHMQKRFLQSSSTLSNQTSSSSSFTVQYLVNSCGFPLDSALSVSKKIQIDEKNQQTTKSVVDFFKSHNFSDSQVAELILKYPQVLQCNVKGNLQPKLEYFVANGFRGERLPMLILSNYKILLRSLDGQIKPSVEYLSWCLSRLSIKRFSWLLTSNLKDNIQPNIDFLMKEGMPAESFGKLVSLHPRHITQNLDRTVYAVNSLRELGFEPSAPMSVHAFVVILSMSKSTWKKKIEFMKSMGFEEEEILLAFKENPFILASSEKKIKDIVDFFMNTVKLEPQALIANPRIVNFSVEKTLRPRYSILKFLESKELFEGTDNILTVLMAGEKNFLKRYIYKYINIVPDLLAIYLDSKDNKKAKTIGA